MLKSILRLTINFGIKLTDGQKQAYDLAHEDGTKELVLCWSRQSGKSVLAEILLIEYLYKPNTTNVYISPTYQLGRKIHKEIIRLLTPTGIISKSNSSTLTIDTVLGSSLQFFTAQSPQAIRGTTCNGILICDEAAYYPRVLPNGEDIWANVIYPITKARHPLKVLISTPMGKSGFFWEHYCQGLSGNEDGIKSIKRTIYDDSLVSNEEIEAIKRQLPELSFRQEFLCEFVDDALTFFRGFDKCVGDVIPTNRCWIGADMSADGSDATVVTTIYDNGAVKQDVISGNTENKCKEIARIIDGAQGLVAAQIEINGVGAPMYDIIRKYCRRRNHLRPFTTTNASKEEIVSDLAVAIEGGKITFDDKGLYKELSTFVVKVSKSAKLTFAASGNNHDDRVMSLAIAYNTMQKHKLPASLAFTPSSLNIIR